MSCEEHELNTHASRINEFLISSNRNTSNVLVLDTIASFKWDELIIFGPYSDVKEISKKRKNNLKIFPSNIKHHDKFIMIGFINKKKGVKYLQMNRNLLDDSIFQGSEGNFKIYPKKESNILF